MGKAQAQPTKRSRLVARLVAAANGLESDDLAVAIDQVESLARHRSCKGSLISATASRRLLSSGDFFSEWPARCDQLPVRHADLTALTTCDGAFEPAFPLIASVRCRLEDMRV